MQLDSLSRNANVAVIGASGGIGGAFVEILSGIDRVAHVHAFSRSPAVSRRDNIYTHQLDLRDEGSIAAARDAASGKGPIDLVIVATGILHRGDELRPEKSLRQVSAGPLAEVFAINSIGPALIAKHFLPALRRDAKTVFAILSARVGSIEDNRLGGWLAYRMSKAAVNMLVRTVAIEQARSWPASVVVALHPGTVATGLSRPFTDRVDKINIFSPAYAAEAMLGVIDNLEQKDSGGFFAYDGSAIGF